MEHRHKAGFCLPCVLSKITPLLPHQGPIKDFIHQNTLQVFLDKPFHEALALGAEVYGAKSYMDLDFYRKEYFTKKIDDALIDEAIVDGLGTLPSADHLIIRQALHTFLKVIDEKTLNYLARNLQINAHQVTRAKEKARETLQRARGQMPLRNILNERLQCSIEHHVNAILFRLIGSYVDQGVILWPLLDECHDFKQAIATLVDQSSLSLAYFVDNNDLAKYLAMPTDDGVATLLGKMFSTPDLYQEYVKESLLNHPGWSGMINVISHHPEMLAKRRTISIREVLLVKFALEWQFIKYIDNDFHPISVQERDHGSKDLATAYSCEELSLAYWFLQNKDCTSVVTSKLTETHLQKIWHIALEKQYYRQITNKFIGDLPQFRLKEQQHSKSFQAVFCIDDRECSFRRHLEAQSSTIETFGFPGFFGIEYFFKPHKKDLLEKMCPAPVTPKYVVMEQEDVALASQKNKRLYEFASFISRHGSNTMFFGFVSAYTLGHLSAFRLLLSFFKPLMLFRRQKLHSHTEKTKLIFEREDNLEIKHHGLLLGFTHEEMAQRVFTSLRNMGLVDNFAPMVLFIGHGSSSVNNPHFAAYDCGACSGRPGGINARLFAAMANIPRVRDLVQKLGITIPKESVFVGGLHDTCTDEVKFFDLENLNTDALSKLQEFEKYLAVAQANNALERCKRFSLVKKNISSKNALKEVRHRARALFEPRPELGHATNALCIVGRRVRSLGKNFDRRAFLQSYDPTKDETGSVLAAVMSAVIPVCGGINLEYFFSRVDAAVYGCGTKLSHNVCSLIGVGNGLDDDLRTGLPIQMTELHDPVRLLIVIEQTPQIIERAVFSNAALVPWVHNDWLKIASLDPRSDQMHMFDASAKCFVPIITEPQ